MYVKMEESRDEQSLSFEDSKPSNSKAQLSRYMQAYTLYFIYICVYVQINKKFDVFQTIQMNLREVHSKLVSTP